MAAREERENLPTLVEMTDDGIDLVETGVPNLDEILEARATTGSDELGRPRRERPTG